MAWSPFQRANAEIIRVEQPGDYANPIPTTPATGPRFMAFEGLVQWTQAVVAQSARVSAARERQSSLGMTSAPPQRRQATHAFHSECHFFAIAAHKLLEYREWVLTFGLCSSVDFSEIAQFSAQDIRDLRNMREHVLDYFRGARKCARQVDRGDTEYRADASSVVGTRSAADWIGLHLGLPPHGYCRNCLLSQSLIRRDHQ